MRTFLLSALGCVSVLLLPSTMAFNALSPEHVAERLVAPNNFAIMTPPDTSSLFEPQLFDFGSPYSPGFSGLRRLGARQGCNSGFDQCQNDPTTCCQLGGDCCGGGVCCRAGSFCYGGGCCELPKVGCNNRGCCDPDADCCSGGGCCASGSHCVTIDGKLGCCPNGQTCEPQASTTASSSTLAPPGPSSVIATTDQITSVPTSVEEATSTDIPQPEPTTTQNGVTRTSAGTQTHQSATGHPSSSSHFSAGPGGVNPTETRGQTTLPSQAGGPGGALFPQSQSTTNVGAIAGGTAAGVVVLIAMLIFLILWRRKQSSESAMASSEKPPDVVEGAPSHGDAYSPEPVPTPGTVDPFLTPMSQHPNPGVTYFGGAIDRPVSVAGSAPYYTGLPEPQHGDELAPAVGTSAMPVPRHDIHHPYPLPMTVTPLREPAAESSPTRVWPGFMPRPPSGQSPGHGGFNAHQGPSGRPNNETTNTNSVYSDPSGMSDPYDLPPPRAPSTVYQPSTEVGENNSNHIMYSPPASPPPESLHPRTFAGNSGGLPHGAAAPVTNFAPAERSFY